MLDDGRYRDPLFSSMVPVKAEAGKLPRGYDLGDFDGDLVQAALEAPRRQFPGHAVFFDGDVVFSQLGPEGRRARALVVSRLVGLGLVATRDEGDIAVDEAVRALTTAAGLGPLSTAFRLMYFAMCRAREQEPDPRISEELGGYGYCVWDYEARPEVVDTIQVLQAHGILVALVARGDRDAVLASVQTLPVAVTQVYAEGVYTPGDFKYFAEIGGVTPDKALVVGRDHTYLTAARSAGTKVVQLLHGDGSTRAVDEIPREVMHVYNVAVVDAIALGVFTYAEDEADGVGTA